MSSRNERLSAGERADASLISITLAEAKSLQSTKTIAEIKAFVEARIKSDPKIQLEYFEISDVLSLQPITEVKQLKNSVACIAVKLGNVRLIDNILL